MKRKIMLLRFLCGAGAGSLISLSFTTVGLTEHPDRNFGLLIMWVLLYGAVVLYLMLLRPAIAQKRWVNSIPMVRG